jgi:hypothetical protein
MRVGGLLYLLICAGTGMIGYEKYHSMVWAIVDFFFTPLTWLIWVCSHGVTLTLIKHTFAWFFV